MGSGNTNKEQGQQEEDLGLTSQVGLIEINWPKAIGYYGAIGVALGFELIEPPIAIFIAAIPLYKMLSHPKLPKSARVVGEVLSGAALPVGGDSEASIHLASTDTQDKQQQHRSIWSEARAIADQRRTVHQRTADT